MDLLHKLSAAKLLIVQESHHTPAASVSGLRMNKKFGGGRQPTGTPSLAFSCVVVVFSLLAGASVVHNIYKPNLTLPPVESLDGNKQQQPEK